MLGKFISPCEDSRTESVFGHLLHLPTEVFWQILRKACYTNALPLYPGELRTEPVFRPSWSADGTINTDRVIPDLFLRFNNLDLIIEAKREDNRAQNRDQWENEVTAYVNEYGAQSIPVRLIALGGIWEPVDDLMTVKAPNSDRSDFRPAGGQSEIRCPVHMCRWSGLLDQCQRMHQDLGRLKYKSSQVLAHQRILSDLINLFACYGFQTGKWFSDLLPTMPSLGERAPSYRFKFKRLS